MTSVVARGGKAEVVETGRVASVEGWKNSFLTPSPFPPVVFINLVQNKYVVFLRELRDTESI